MVLSVKHSKVSAIPDGADTSVVRPSDWNADHTFAGATSGGVPYFSSTTAMDSSGLLTANALMLGGGAGVAPSTPVGLGTTTQVLHGNAGGAPTWGAVSLTADVSGTLPVANGGMVSQHPGYVTGNWYVPYVGTAAAGGVLGNGTIHFIPWVPQSSFTVSALGCRITTVGTTNIQLAIYASQLTAGAGYRPTGNALASTSSIVNTSATSVSGTVSVAVTAGTLYFLAINCNDATCVCVIPTVTTLSNSWLLGTATQSNLISSAAALTHLTFAQAFGTWPDMTSNGCTESTANTYALIEVKR